MAGKRLLGCALTAFQVESAGFKVPSAETKAPILRFMARLSLRLVFVSVVLSGGMIVLGMTNVSQVIAFAKAIGRGYQSELLDIGHNIRNVFTETGSSVISDWSSDGEYLLVSPQRPNQVQLSPQQKSTTHRDKLHNIG